LVRQAWEGTPEAEVEEMEEVDWRVGGGSKLEAPVKLVEVDKEDTGVAEPAEEGVATC
jgi:hypothetical protein